MSRLCDVCGKGGQAGFNVSHAKNRTKKRSYPNLHRRVAVVEGKRKKVKVCTKCLRGAPRVNAGHHLGLITLSGMRT